MQVKFCIIDKEKDTMGCIDVPIKDVHFAEVSSIPVRGDFIYIGPNQHKVKEIRYHYTSIYTDRLKEILTEVYLEEKS